MKSKDIASITLYADRQQDGATGCVMLKNGTRIRVGNAHSMLAQWRPFPYPPEEPLFDQAFNQFDVVMKKIFG